MDACHLSEDRASYLGHEARTFCLCNGVVMRLKIDGTSSSVQHAPFLLLPSRFPRVLFERVKTAQRDFNELVHKVIHDHEFLEQSLRSTIAVDSFTAKVFEIYQQTRNEGLAQPISLGILRSDYMLDRGDDEELGVKQVEINTIASSFGCLSSKMASLYRHILRLEGSSDLTAIEKLPESLALQGIGEGLIRAWELYSSESAVILIIVSDGDTNVFDQKIIEHKILERKPTLTVVWKTLGELNDTGELQEDKSLFVDGKEVAVAYFRAGYVPEHYPSDKEWSARLLIERSRAIKCPSAALHLAGTKKVQQVLAGKGVLERFVPDRDTAQRLRSMFTGLYTLDEGPEGDENMAMALGNPEKYVLKPQLEGGGNNIYGEDIRATLESGAEQRSQFILMDLIRPPVFQNYIVRAEQRDPELADVISELGVFGVLISSPDEILYNKEIGHLLRTKNVVHRDGGVASGRANLDNPLLTS